jgi:hypothetical protein
LRGLQRNLLNAILLLHHAFALITGCPAWATLRAAIFGHEHLAL